MKCVKKFGPSEAYFNKIDIKWARTKRYKR